MNALALLTGYFVIGLAFILFMPLIVIIAVVEWLGYLWHGPARPHNIPESRESFERWRAKMEQGRRIQAQEENK